MSTKTENVKTFINQVGKENQLFLFVGNSTNTDASSNSAKATIDTWKESDFSIKLGKDNVIAVVPKIKWVRNRSYSPWDSYGQANSNNYIYNDNNGYVYLCISDDADNRADLSGNKGSYNIPSHISGDYTYDDGYTWKALYKITPSLEKFVTETWIPVISFDTYETGDKSSPFAQLQSSCSPYSAEEDGNCAIYYKENTQYYNKLGTLTNSNKGSRSAIFTNLSCSECYQLFANHPIYTSRFYKKTTDLTIDIKDTSDIVGDLISQNIISTASPYYYLYYANANSPDEGYVVSANIDLSAFDLSERKISAENPELTVISNTGVGASIILKTYLGNDGNNYVTGIQVVSGGSGYKDIAISLTSANLLGAKTAEDLISNIKINLDDVDGLGFDPMKALNVQHTMIDVRVDKHTLQTSNVSVPSSINFYSLIQNPKYGSNTAFQYQAGSSENKYQTTVTRTTTKITIALGGKSAPVQNSNMTIIDSTGKVVNNLGIAQATNTVDFLGPIPSFADEAEMELKQIEYTDNVNLAGGTIISDGESYTILSLDATPNLVQYSGKVLSSTKTTAIAIQDTDTALIRINMVKGM